MKEINENAFTTDDGITLYAIRQKSGLCFGCYLFAEDFDCNKTKTKVRPSCVSCERLDNRDIIWVEKKKGMK